MQKSYLEFSVCIVRFSHPRDNSIRRQSSLVHSIQKWTEYVSFTIRARSGSAREPAPV